MKKLFFTSLFLTLGYWAVAQCNLTATIASSTSICSGDSTLITFTGPPNGLITYAANGGSNQFVPLDGLGNNAIYTAPLTTTIYDLVSVEDGVCSTAVTGSVTVTVLPLPAATITPSGTTTMCMNSNGALLSANTGTGYAYQWKLGSTVISGATSSTYNVTTAGDYSVVVTENGCSQASLITTVDVITPPVIIISPNVPTSICESEAPYIMFGGSPGGPLVTVVEWLKDNVTIPGATGSSIQITASGSYAIVMAYAGCADTAAVQITVNPNPAPVIVQNGSVLSTTIPYNSYIWKWNGSTIGFQPTQPVSMPGAYSVEVMAMGSSCIGSSAPFTPVSVTNIILTELNVYPNPSNGTFLIKGHVSNQSNKATIRITDIAGRTITEEEIQVSNNTIEKRMNLSQLSAGMYMLFIMCDNERQVIPLTIN